MMGDKHKPEPIRPASRMNAGVVASAWLLGMTLLAGMPAQTQAAPMQAAPVSAEDATGRRITLAHPALRVITLAPHLTEIMFAIHAGSLIVGTTASSDFPESARTIRRIGDDFRPDAEQILIQRPDLILVWQPQAASRTLARLREQGIPIYVSNARSASDVATDMRRIGSLTGHDADAGTVAHQWEQRLQALTRQYSGLSAVRVFFQIWPRPLYTIGGTQFISTAIKTCGGINIFGNLAADAPVVAREAVLAARPELILATGNGDQLAQWRAFTSLPATQNNQLVSLPPDLLSRPGPRLLDGIDNLCEAIDHARHSKSE